MNSQTRDNHTNNSHHYSQHHSFDINLACQYGIQESILIHHFIFWISLNKRLNRNFRDGKWWTYQTQEEIGAHFPYLSRKQIMRILDRLVQKQVIIKGNYNKSAIDHTTWYAFTDDKFLNNFYDCPKVEQSEVGQSSPKVGQSIPDNKTTDTKKTTTTTPITQEVPEKVAVAFLNELLKDLPLTPAEQASFSLQFDESQLKHMAAYYRGRIAVTPDFIPDSWASYLANATREGYAVPQRTKPVEEERKAVNEKDNAARAQKAHGHLLTILKEGEELYLTSLSLSYRNVKKQLMNICFNDPEFDQLLNELYKIIKNTRQ